VLYWGIFLPVTMLGLYLWWRRLLEQKAATSEVD
jgi:hypothetical protein